MDRFLIRGGRPLHGDITIGGAKNAALAIMPCALLTSETLSLKNMPGIMDIKTMCSLLEQHGLNITINDNDPHHYSFKGDITNTEAPYKIVSKMRASVLVLGPLLARCGKARVSLPGGCAIGTRPVNLHLDALTALGAEIEIDGGYINATAPKGLTGTRFVFPFVSVGATENTIMAASLAKGRTELLNAAREPEICDLIDCLVAMGAKIQGKGTSHLIIDGVDSLHGAEHSILFDRIECGTYACAAGITGGELRLIGAKVEYLGSVIHALEECGVEVFQEENAIRVRRTGSLRGIDIMTEAYPGFPTDMQAQFMALLSISEGASMITETIFENRFMHVPELNRMGARINVHGSSAIIRGVHSLSGAPVMATDLRASFSLILAGLAAAGETSLNRVYHLDRGYEAVEKKLSACGAQIERIKS
ncbi:UDP-N-acetylglucosamine 1-carboxyvinyltransferase [Commensalibacter oyaizuii]|uniref:UDP-N-acetylglucosamine 1-carboxyvinyltransferase n=1 Tax=Commensalibacter oyaizuii TaxID=3043873 RepID=A0ABT6Q307_9PROT|nr:UDP-N-acetylglucosamine 1-carboxyvinyltransferase [Commensalibacter sp. TBRC 16381]MDI2091479.1 UDP-N-acetylglucosamine 1-carboxyvinyltransferase [Commensalibacter sp. TBRC 16381]